MRRFFLAGLLTAGLVALAGTALAATTSNLSGKVTDKSNNEPLPGVTVTLSSPQLIGGERSAVSDENGNYRFVALTPGYYTVKSTLSGFDEASGEIRLLLGKDSVLNLGMQVSGVTAEAVVVAEAPVVEVTNTTVKTSIDDELVENIPVLNRDFLALATLVPGVNADPDSGGLNVSGGRFRETSFSLDGLNITDASQGTRAANVNLDAVQELEVITNGFSAEFGKAQGGVVNVITKSGGNDYHGSASYYFRGDVFDGVSNDISIRRDELKEAGNCDADGKPDCEDVVLGQEFERHDLYLTAEGPIVQDKLWFFATGQVLQDDQVVNGLREEWDAGETTQTESLSIFGKATAQVSEKNTLALAYNRDPRDLKNFRLGPASGTSYWTSSVTPSRETGGWLGSVRDTHVFSENMFVEALVGFQKNKVAAEPVSDTGFFGAALYPVDGVYVQRGGKYPFAFSSDRERIQGKLDLTYYADWAGSHTFKTGVDMERLGEKSVNSYDPQFYGWDEATYDPNLEVSPFGGTQRDPNDVTQHVDLNGDGVIDTDPETLELIGYAYVFETEQANFDLNNTGISGYVQDEWQPTEQLTLNLGVRIDRELEINNIGGNVNIAPRFGVSFDPTGDGRLQLFGNTGIVYDKLNLDVLTYVFGGAINRLLVYAGPHTGSDPADYFRFEDFNPADPTQGALAGTGFSTPDKRLLDEDVKNPYTWYSTVGAKYEVIQDLAIGASFIYREGKDLLQDVETNKEYIEGTGVVSIDPNFDNIFLLTNVNSSEYKAMQLEVNKRFSNGWQLLASYTLSRAEGDGRDYTRLPTAGNNQDGNDVALFVSEYSVLSYDRTHDFNVSGNVNLPLGLQLGWSGYHQTGTPYSKYFTINQASINDGLFQPNQLRGTTYVEGKNAFRLPNQTNLDLHLEKGFGIGPAKLQVMADVFNVFDEDTAVQVNQQVAYRDFDGDGDNEFSPTFGAPTQRVFGRRFQLGAKISF